MATVARQPHSNSARKTIACATNSNLMALGREPIGLLTADADMVALLEIGGVQIDDSRVTADHRSSLR
jgi:hypothetical protein